VAITRSQNNRAFRSNPNMIAKEENYKLLWRIKPGHKITEPSAQIPTNLFGSKHSKPSLSQNNRAFRSNPNSEDESKGVINMSQNNRAFRSNPNAYINEKKELFEGYVKSQNNRAFRSNPNNLKEKIFPNLGW